MPWCCRDETRRYFVKIPVKSRLKALKSREREVRAHPGSGRSLIHLGPAQAPREPSRPGDECPTFCDRVQPIRTMKPLPEAHDVPDLDWDQRIPLWVCRPSLPPLCHYGERNCREFLDVHYCTVPLGDATRRPTPDAELPALSAGVVRKWDECRGCPEV